MKSQNISQQKYIKSLTEIRWQHWKNAMSRVPLDASKEGKSNDVTILADYEKSHFSFKLSI
jgi:hypothetical protein